MLKPFAILTKIGMGDNVVDVTQHVKFYCTPFRGFCSPIYVIFRTIWGDVFNAFLGSCNSLQPTPLNGFLRKNFTPKDVVPDKDVPFGGPDDHN